VETIILPADNRQDVEEDLTPELMQGVTVHYARHIEDVLAVALPLFKAQPVAVAPPAQSQGKPASAAA
jgi:ATP-dependent Lon protease